MPNVQRRAIAAQLRRRWQLKSEHIPKLRPEEVEEAEVNGVGTELNRRGIAYNGLNYFS
jgi:hypothetical protein